MASGEIVGSINFGYGDPPKDPERLDQLSQTYGVDVDVLQAKAEAYESRPAFVVELAKKRLQTAAKLIGEIVARRQAEEGLKNANAELEQFNRLAVGREERMIELKREVNEMAQSKGEAAPYDLSFIEAE